MAERILVVEDDRELRLLLVDLLGEAGYEVAAFGSAESALRALEQPAEPDLVITDLMLPGLQGLDLLRELRRRRPETHVIVMTAFGSIDSAIGLVKAGAFDYLTKPLRTGDVLLAVERALAESGPRREVARRQRAEARGAPIGFVGSSPAMREVFDAIGRMGPSPHPVLITGESGTGKELAARSLHHLSGRRAFVAVNCGALPEALLESELFGHERGAFTGAERTKEGLFEVADGGTLFLDEIAELPRALQPKLLRALEQSEIRRVGATASRTVDVRLIAATNRDLEAETSAQRFRDDLFWRLNVLAIRLPPLRERAGDIPLLAEHFLARADAEARAGVSGSSAEAAPPHVIADEAMELLRAYPWPGNVRELRNAILRVATLATGPSIGASDLPSRVRDGGRLGTLVGEAARRRLTLSGLERTYILTILRETNGNRSRAAEILGLDRKTLYRKLEEYHAEDPTLTL